MKQRYVQSIPKRRGQVVDFPGPAPRVTARGILARLGLEREDLLAIPLCLLWGMGYVMSCIGVSGAFIASASQATAGSGGPLALWQSVISVPLALMRQFLG